MMVNVATRVITAKVIVVRRPITICVLIELPVTLDLFVARLPVTLL
jgi:hypothetical protein